MAQAQVKKFKETKTYSVSYLFEVISSEKQGIAYILRNAQGQPLQIFFSLEDFTQFLEKLNVNSEYHSVLK